MSDMKTLEKPRKASKAAKRTQTPKNVKKDAVAVTVKPKRQYNTTKRTQYSTKLATEYCGYVATGMSLRTACQQKGMPSSGTVFNWLASYPEFVDLYARAKESAADAFLEDIQDIADKTLKGEYNAKAAKVAIDAKIWAASKLKPKKYGERLDVTSGGEAIAVPNIYLPAEMPYTAVTEQARKVLEAQASTN